MTKPASQPKEYAAEVRGHYEDLPYPYCDPEREGEVFNGADGLSADAFNHYGWEGKRDLRDGARILVAGCGTGDMAVSFAEQFLGSKAEIVAIDLSTASINLAKARMKKRGLNNVDFHHMSILDLPTSDLGTFDIIECSGVLHHLPDPNAGLAALANVLKPDGLMAVMVYAHYGRMSIYLVQELMKKLMTLETPRARKIDIAKEFLNLVPSGHWLTVNNSHYLSDLSMPDGSGIYDLFLHSTDRAYTVPQLYDWVEGAGLTMIDLFSEYTNSSKYNPESYTTSPVLRDIVRDKPLPERQAIAELMHGNMNKHYFYAAKQPKKVAQLNDDMVITYGSMQWLFHSFVADFLKTLATTMPGGQVEGLPRPFEGSPALSIVKTKHVEMLLSLIDGKRTVGEMIAVTMRSAGSDLPNVARDLAQLYNELSSLGLVYLRHQSIAPYVTGPEIVQRINKHLGKK